MHLPGKLYDVLKYVTIIGFPALAAFYGSLGDIWGLPKTTEVVGTILTLQVLLGALLVLNQVGWRNSDARYDGVIDPMSANAQTSSTALTLSTDEYDAANQKEVVLKVKQAPPLIEH